MTRPFFLLLTMVASVVVLVIPEGLFLMFLVTEDALEEEESFRAFDH